MSSSRALLPVVRNEYVELLAGCLQRIRPDLEPLVLPVEDPLAEGSVFRALPLTNGDPVQAILAAARQERAALIAMACEAHRPWWSSLRSLVENALRSSPVPVLVAKPTPAQLRRLSEPIRRILVPLDGSLPADGVLPEVLQLAKIHRAEVVLLHVEELSSPSNSSWQAGLYERLSETVDVSPDELAELGYPLRAMQRLGERHSRLEGEGVCVRSEVALGDVVDEINTWAEQSDLLVISKSGLRLDGDQHWFGSVSKHVLRSTLVPVIVCPAGGSSRLPRLACDS